MKILVSAYACEPGKGSEPEVGWQWVHQIARFHETWVLTRGNNRHNIESGLRDKPQPNLHFEYIDLPDWAKFWKKGNRGVHAYYLIWQVLAAFKARELHRRIKFDLVHHVTFVNDWIGPGIALLPIKLIWGPMGSNPYVSWRLIDSIGKREYGAGLLRLFLRKTAPFRDPLVQLALRRSKKILCCNKEVISRLPKPFRAKTLVFPQNAIAIEEVIPRRIENHEPLKIISVGRFVGIKGFRLTLQSFASHHQKHPSSRLNIVGDGAQRKELEGLANELGISSSVTFTGQIPRNQVLELMANSDVFLFPSFEGGGMVMIEAMSKGLPVVCLDFGGPGEYVTADCGIKAPLTSPQKVIEELAEGLNRLASEPELYARMSAGAIQRVRENFLWNQVGERLNKIYQEVATEK